MRITDMIFCDTTVVELRRLAREQGIRGRSKMNKAQLWDALHRASEPPTSPIKETQQLQPEQEAIMDKTMVQRAKIKGLLKWLNRQSADLDRGYVLEQAKLLSIETRGKSIVDLTKQVAVCLAPVGVFGIWNKRRSSGLAQLMKDRKLHRYVFLTENAEEEELLEQGAVHNGLTLVEFLNVDGVNVCAPDAPYFRTHIWVLESAEPQVKEAMGVQPMSSGQKALKQKKYVGQLIAPNYMGARVVDFDESRVRQMPDWLAAMFDGVIYARASMVDSWLPKGQRLNGAWLLCLTIFRLFAPWGQPKGGLIPMPDHFFPDSVDMVTSDTKDQVLVQLPAGKAIVCFNGKWTQTKEATTDFQTLVNNFLLTSPRLVTLFKKTLDSLKERFMLLKEEGMVGLMEKGNLLGLEERDYRDSTTDTLAAMSEAGLNPKAFARVWTKAVSRCTDGTVDPERVRMAGGSFNDSKQWITYAMRTYIQVHPGPVFRWLWQEELGSDLDAEVQGGILMGLPNMEWLVSDAKMKDGVLYTDPLSFQAIMENHGSRDVFITRNPNTMTGGCPTKLEGLEGTPQCTYWVKAGEQNWKKFFSNQDGADLDDAFTLWLGKWASIAIEHYKVFKSSMIRLADGTMSFLEAKKLKQIQNAIMNPVAPWNWDEVKGEPIEEGNIIRIEDAVAKLNKDLDDCPYETVNQMAEIQSAFSGMTGYAANWQMAMALVIQGLIEMPPVKDKNGRNVMNVLAQAGVSVMLSDVIDCETQGANPDKALRAMKFFAACSRYMSYQINKTVFPKEGPKNWNARNLTIPRLGVMRMVGQMKRDLTPKQKWENDKPVTKEVFGQQVPVMKEHGRWIANPPDWPAYDLFRDYIDWVIQEIRNDIDEGLNEETMAKLGEAANQLMLDDEWLKANFPRRTPDETRQHAKELYAVTAAYSREREALSRAFSEAKMAGAKIDTDLLAERIGDLNDEWLQNSWPDAEQEDAEMRKRGINDRMLMCMMVMIAKWRKINPTVDYKVKLQKNNLSLQMPGIYDEVLWLQDLSHDMEVLKTGPWRMTINTIKMLMIHARGISLDIKVEMLMRKGRRSEDYLTSKVLGNETAQAKIKAAIMAQHEEFDQNMQVQASHSWELVPASSRRTGTVNYRWKGRRKMDVEARDRIMASLKGRKILDIEFIKKLDGDQTNVLVVLER
jgi:hypothetical protein